jgi:hypothetical protein
MWQIPLIFNLLVRHICTFGKVRDIFIECGRVSLKPIIFFLYRNKGVFWYTAIQREPDFIDVEASLSPSPEDQSAQPEAAQDRPALTPAVERKHFPWLIPSFMVIHVDIFIGTMYINNCPKRRFYRFRFQSIEQKPHICPTPITLSYNFQFETKLVSLNS